MTSLIFTDTHWTDKPIDEYRWGIFPWLRKQIEKCQADEILHLGDATEAKDRHSSVLVNRLCDELAKFDIPFYWCKGNHDYYAASEPFFRFINNIPNLYYISDLAIKELSVGKATFVPAGIPWNFRLHSFPYTFTHATFNGAESENGTLLRGIDPVLLSNYDGIVFSGDVHVGQEIAKGKIVYVGAPYHIKFGDKYQPRVMLLNNDGSYTSLYYPAPKKHTFLITRPEHLEEEKGDPGDYVKIVCMLKRAEYTEWKKYKQEIREIAENRDWRIFGIECRPLEVTVDKNEKTVQSVLLPENLIRGYVKAHKATKDHLEIGLELLKD